MRTTFSIVTLHTGRSLRSQGIFIYVSEVCISNTYIFFPANAFYQLICLFQWASTQHVLGTEVGTWAKNEPDMVPARRKPLVHYVLSTLKQYLHLASKQYWRLEE